MHYVINFVFSIGKQPYRDVINFVSYIHVVYSYNDINFTYLYMRINCLRHLANIVDILWSRPVWGGGGGNSQLNWLTAVSVKKCNFAVADKHDAVDLLEVIDGQAIYHSKFNLFVKINQTISIFYIYDKCMTYHIISFFERHYIYTFICFLHRM